MNLPRPLPALAAGVLASALALAGGAAAAAPCTPSTGGTSPVSGLPLPKACAAARPSGAAGNLRVLDWAGFKGAVTYTFDDASPSQIQHYAELTAPGLRLTFYVSPTNVARTDPDGNSLVDAWRKVAADGHELGNHTLDHCKVSADGNTLTGCIFGTPDATSDTAAKQIAIADDYIKATLGQKDAAGHPAVWTMASPFGDGNWDSFARAAGYVAHRDVWIDRAGSFLAPADVANVYRLPCFAGGGRSSGFGVDASQATMDQIVDDARGRGRWGIFLFHGVGPSTWDAGACCPVPAAVIAESMNRLKAWGDVWGDSMVNVASYTIGENLFRALTPAQASGATTWTWTLPAGFPPGKYLRVAVDGGTLTQTIDGVERTLPWNERGFYEVSLSAGNLTLSP